MRRVVVMMALLATFASAVGCGDASSQQTEAGERSLTKAQWVKRAYATCYRLGKKQIRQMKTYNREHGLNPLRPDRGERERVNAAVVLPIVEERIEKLAALPAPKGEEAEIGKILASMKAGLRETEAHPQWLAEPTVEHPEPFTKTLKLTADYGVWVCGQP